ncbi:ribonuclease Y [bacterium]|nr:ribonuclease Y [bacterium]
MEILIPAIVAIVGLIAGGALGWIIASRAGKSRLQDAEARAQQIIAESNHKSEIILKEADLSAKDKLIQMKQDFERETQSKRHEIHREDKKLAEKESSIERKMDLLRKKERDIQSRERLTAQDEKQLRLKQNELEDLIEHQNRQLEKVAMMSAGEAKALLMNNLENEARAEAAKIIKDIKERAEANAEREARQIIVDSIQRCAADTTAESTVSVVNLPTDELKGRIIGREGRNIRAFETATGVDVIVDDTPDTVILSAFDPIRRETARIALEKLIIDGRIHPARIEETVKKAEKEMDVIIREAGEQACFEVGIHDLDPELIKLLGRLKYRTSYGQNVLLHSIEVAHLSGYIASLLELDPLMAKRCGLLHDIGKSVDKGQEGTHTELGFTIARRYNEKQIVLNSILSHHEDVDAETPYAIITKAADAISGARPGARRETLENYVKRLERLEKVADGFAGVEKSYAIQAGREIRVIVEPEEISDKESSLIASEVAQKIQEELEYPGQIKVTVIRETRAVEYAR